AIARGSGGWARPSSGLGARLLAERPPALPALGGLRLQSARLPARHVIALALHVAEQPRPFHALLEPAQQLFEAFPVASEYLHPLPPYRRVIRAPRPRRATVPGSRPLPEEHDHGLATRTVRGMIAGPRRRHENIHFRQER